MITLETLTDATAQEVFDQVKNHLLEQNESALENDKCKYHYNGLKCAAGCLIADDEYDPIIENRDWADLVDMEYAPTAHVTLIMDLQDIHDNCLINLWKTGLKEVARQHDLNYEE